MREYVINYFVWWYWIRLKDVAKGALSQLMFYLQYTNALPMARYLFVPLYQDNTGVGRIISVIIRLTWAWIGGVLSVMMAVPNFIFLLLWVLLPVIVGAQIILGLTKVIYL
jgi:hypothetical protein